MASKSINVTVEEELITRADRLVNEKKYPNRSQLVQAAIEALLKQIDAESIGEQAKLLKENADSEEWFEGELEQWQEKY